MAQHQYYPEEVLIEKMQSGEYGWLDYVNHFSAEWQEEYARYCEERNLVIGNDSAAESLQGRTAGSGDGGRKRIADNNHNIRLWQYEPIQTPERWTCSLKCATY